MKNKTTLYHLILDRSGSMHSCHSATIKAFNAQMESIRELQETYPEQEFIVSLTVFNSEVDQIVDMRPMTKKLELSAKDYSPQGSTALLDAIGMSIKRIQRNIGHKVEKEEASVVVVVLTDGYENDSKRFTYKEVAKLIKKMEKTGQWTFSFIGADVDAWDVSRSLNIRTENIVAFDKEDMEGMMDEVSQSMQAYAASKQSGFTKADLLDTIRRKDQRKK